MSLTWIVGAICGARLRLDHSPSGGRRLPCARKLASDVGGEEALFHCGDEAQGFVRFINLNGVKDRLRIRASSTRPL